MHYSSWAREDEREEYYRKDDDKSKLDVISSVWP